MISSMSFGVITYPNRSHEIVWLPDASVKYLCGKHIALFILGTLILMVGVVYTFLLLFWQWLLKHQNQRLLKWTGHQKLCHFIEPHHTPYAFKHQDCILYQGWKKGAAGERMIVTMKSESETTVLLMRSRVSLHAWAL